MSHPEGSEANPHHYHYGSLSGSGSVHIQSGARDESSPVICPLVSPPLHLRRPPRGSSTYCRPTKTSTGSLCNWAAGSSASSRTSIRFTSCWNSSGDCRYSALAKRSSIP